MNEWEDRIVDRALHELHGEQPPDLGERIAAAVRAGVRVPARPVPARRGPALIFATALTAVAAAVFAMVWLQWREGSQEAPVARVELAVLAGVTECVEIAAADRPERRWRLAAGTAQEWTARPGNRLRSVGRDGMDLLVRPFGVVTTEPHTDLEVRSMELTVKNGMFAAGALSFAVVAGVATWHTMTRTATAEAGQVLRLEAQGDGGAGASKLLAEKTRLEQELAEAKRQNEELATQLARRAAESPAVPEPKGDAPAPAEAKTEDGKMPPAFDDAQFRDALAAVDWQLVGSVTDEMGPKLVELIAAMEKEGAEMPMELAVAIQKLNMKLVEQLPALMKSGLPGFGPNGAYTHPLVVANSLASVLQQAGQGLGEGQRSAIAGLVRAFSAENQAIHEQTSDLDLQALANETEMKDRFYREVGTQLTPAQLEHMFPTGAGTHDGSSLFSTGLLYQGYSDPIPAANATEFARTASQKLEQQLGLDPQRAEQVHAVLERAAAQAPELWRDKGTPAETSIRLLKSGRAKAALDRQLQWMREIQRQVQLTPEQQQKLKALKRVFVPLPR